MEAEPVSLLNDSSSLFTTQHKSIKYTSLPCRKFAFGFPFKKTNLEMQPSAVSPVLTKHGGTHLSPSIWETVAGTLPWAWGQPGLQSDTLIQNQKQVNNGVPCTLYITKKLGLSGQILSCYLKGVLLIPRRDKQIYPHARML